jgi:hypothetical protein
MLDRPKITAHQAAPGDRGVPTAGNDRARRRRASVGEAWDRVVVGVRLGRKEGVWATPRDRGLAGGEGKWSRLRETMSVLI